MQTPARKLSAVMVRLPLDLAERVDLARGDVPRDRWVRSTLYDLLGDRPLKPTVRMPAPQRQIPGQTSIYVGDGSDPTPKTSHMGDGRDQPAPRTSPLSVAGPVDASAAGSTPVSPLTPACPDCAGDLAAGVCGDCGWRAS